MTRTRYIAASFIAPVAALVIPALVTLAQLRAEADLMPDGSYDDAGMRSAGLFLLVAMPILYLIAAMYYAAAGHILAKVNRLSRNTTVGLAAAIPWSLVALAAIGFFANNRVALPGIGLLVFLGVVMSIFSAIGGLVWWFIAVGNVARSDA